MKTVSPYQLKKASIIKGALPHTAFVRLPGDEIQDQNALLYDYVTEGLQQLAKRVKFNWSQIKLVCHDVLQASNFWVACTEFCFIVFQKYLGDVFEPAGFRVVSDRCDPADIKSKNVLADYRMMPDGNVDIKRVYLIDTKKALYVGKGRAIHVRYRRRPPLLAQSRSTCTTHDR